MLSTSSPGLIVAASGCGPATRLARSLARHDQTVALLSDQPGESHPGLTQLHCAFDSAAAVDAGFAQAVARLGTVRHVVFSAVPQAAVQTAAIGALSLAEWNSACHATVKAALYGLQAAQRRIPGLAAFTLLGPNVSLTGAAGLVPLCTAVEAQRTLAKAAARQWGAHGLRVNWVALAAPEFDDAFAAMRLPEVPELGPPPPALGRRIDIDTDVLPAVEFLGSPAARGMTGLTINLDGGHWMLP
jgi:NAD(P)-dependent dehydrogenase (short-subunit alcohol dehydrogenase family)